MIGNARVEDLSGATFIKSPDSKESCLAGCLKVEGATACQYDSFLGTCYALKGEAVTGANGGDDAICWKLSTGQGKSQYFQKKIEFKVPHRCYYA